MRVIVCGGRDYGDRAFINASLDRIHKDQGIELLAEGGANGADHIARMWAEKNGIPHVQMPAPWKKFGVGAGPIRNGWMLRFLSPHAVVAFPGGRGTEDMKRQARKAGVHVMDLAPLPRHGE